MRNSGRPASWKSALDAASPIFVTFYRRIIVVMAGERLGFDWA
jgi:hypothetical protein